MTQEEKQLLLIDLSARLPYGVKAEITAHNLDYEEDFGKVVVADVCGIQTPKDDDGNLISCVITCYDKYKTQGNDIESIKPYLRPMSSMTEKERKEAIDMGISFAIKDGVRIFDGFGNVGAEEQLMALDWLNKKMFDFRGLIPMGLALEAKEDTYKTE